jgi:Mg2+ and Co2+ transporter CorA
LTARFEKIQQQSNVGPSPPHKILQRTATVSCPISSPKWNDLNNENIVPNYSSNPPSNPPPAPPGPPALSDSKEVNETKESKEVKELKELKDVMLTPKGSKMSLNEVLQKLNHLEMRVTVKEKFAETEQTDIKRQMEDMKLSLDNLVSVINHLSSVKFVAT